MDVEKIRALRLAHPFKPFNLVLTDGRTLPVERASYVAISPTGRSIAYARSQGGFEFVAADRVQDAVVDENMSTAWRRLARP